MAPKWVEKIQETAKDLGKKVVKPPVKPVVEKPKKDDEMSLYANSETEDYA